METTLTGVSPVSFMVAREGDALEIRPVRPNPSEIRAKTAALGRGFLVFKDKTMIGTLPPKSIEECGPPPPGSHCRVTRMDKASSTIVVEMPCNAKGAAPGADAEAKDRIRGSGSSEKKGSLGHEGRGGRARR